MKMEIHDNHKISIFISEAELTSRGYDYRNHESNIALINFFLDEALLFVESTHDIPAMDMLSRTEASYVPNEGMYLTIYLMERSEAVTEDEPMQNPTLTSLFFAFRDFEELAQCAAKMPVWLRDSGKLFVYKGKYLLQVQEGDFLGAEEYVTATSIIGEYGQRTNEAPAIVETYGKVIMEENALEEIARRFPC